MESGYTVAITDSTARLESIALVLYSLKIIKSDSIIQMVILTFCYLYD